MNKFNSCAHQSPPHPFTDSHVPNSQFHIFPFSVSHPILNSSFTHFPILTYPSFFLENSN